MSLLKPDFLRSLAIGFAAGALLVAGTTGLGGINLAKDIVPSATAAAAD